MTKRPSRANLPQRNENGRRKYLTLDLSSQALATRFSGIRYVCYSKHKSNPYIYGLQPYQGQDSDRTLCDTHAGFSKKDLSRIPALLVRARTAGLTGNLIWTIDDNGWIYELQITNVTQNEWHGYPMLPSNPFARQVWMRFSAWADQNGSNSDKDAANNCALLYGLRP